MYSSLLAQNVGLDAWQLAPKIPQSPTISNRITRCSKRFQHKFIPCSQLSEKSDQFDSHFDPNLRKRVPNVQFGQVDVQPSFVLAERINSVSKEACVALQQLCKDDKNSVQFASPKIAQEVCFLASAIKADKVFQRAFDFIKENLSTVFFDENYSCYIQETMKLARSCYPYKAVLDLYYEYLAQHLFELMESDNFSQLEDEDKQAIFLRLQNSNIYSLDQFVFEINEMQYDDDAYVDEYTYYKHYQDIVYYNNNHKDTQFNPDFMYSGYLCQDDKKELQIRLLNENLYELDSNLFQATEDGQFVSLEEFEKKEILFCLKGQHRYQQDKFIYGRNRVPFVKAEKVVKEGDKSDKMYIETKNERLFQLYQLSQKVSKAIEKVPKLFSTEYGYVYHTRLNDIMRMLQIVYWNVYLSKQQLSDKDGEFKSHKLINFAFNFLYSFVLKLPSQTQFVSQRQLARMLSPDFYVVPSTSETQQGVEQNMVTPVTFPSDSNDSSNVIRVQQAPISKTEICFLLSKIIQMLTSDSSEQERKLQILVEFLFLWVYKNVQEENGQNQCSGIMMQLPQQTTRRMQLYGAFCEQHGNIVKQIEEFSGFSSPPSFQIPAPEEN